MRPRYQHHGAQGDGARCHRCPPALSPSPHPVAPSSLQCQQCPVLGDTDAGAWGAGWAPRACGAWLQGDTLPWCPRALSSPCPGCWALGEAQRAQRSPPMEPGGAGEPPGSSAPSLAARPLTGAVPFSLLSAGHADDLQRGQGAGAALQAEGEGGGGAQILSVPGRAAPSPLQGPAVPALRAGFVPGRTTWCGRKPRA